MKKLFENWRRFTNESMGDPPEAEGWLQQAEMVMEEIVEEGHGTSVADDVDYAIYKVGEMDPAAEQWLTQNKDRVLALHPNRSMAEGVKTCKKGDPDYEAGYAAAENSTSVDPPADADPCWKMGWNAAL